MNKINRVLATLALAMTLVSVGFVASGANAAGTATGGGDAVGDKFADLLADITTIYIPAFLGLVIVGIAFRMGIKWLRKGATNA